MAWLPRHPLQLHPPYLHPALVQQELTVLAMDMVVVVIIVKREVTVFTVRINALVVLWEHLPQRVRAPALTAQQAAMGTTVMVIMQVHASSAHLGRIKAFQGKLRAAVVHKVVTRHRVVPVRAHCVQQGRTHQRLLSPHVATGTADVPTLFPVQPTVLHAPWGPIPTPCARTVCCVPPGPTPRPPTRRARRVRGGPTTPPSGPPRSPPAYRAPQGRTASQGRPARYAPQVK